MHVDIEEIGVEKIRKVEFLLGTSISDSHLIYAAPLDQETGPQKRWMVIDHDIWEGKDGNILIYTTEEMVLLYKGMKEADSKPVKADKDIGYRFLVRSGKLRMKVKDGCPGCRRFWGGDCSEGQCSKCHRCYVCCGRESVSYSCASGQAQEEKKGSYGWRKH